MNCKQGDLAIVVRSKYGNLGKVVTCLKLHPPGTATLMEELGPVWETDNDSIALGNAGVVSIVGRFICDSRLRPLRDSDGTDETLSWIDVPNEVTA